MDGLDLLGAMPINKPSAAKPAAKIVLPKPAAAAVKLAPAAAAKPTTSTAKPTVTPSKSTIKTPPAAAKSPAAAKPSAAKLQTAQKALTLARSMPKRMAKQAQNLATKAQRAITKAQNTGGASMGSSLLGWSMDAVVGVGPPNGGPTVPPNGGSQENDAVFLAALDAVSNAIGMATRICAVLDVLSAGGTIIDADKALRQAITSAMGGGSDFAMLGAYYTALIGYEVNDVVSEGNGLLSRLSSAVDSYDPDAPDPAIPGIVKAVGPDFNSWTGRVNALAKSTIATTGTGTTTDPSGTTTTTGAPTISSVQGASGMPNSGAPGEQVNILGQNLSGVTAVSFTGIPTQFTVVSPTQINALVPPQAMSGTVQVTTSTGVAQAQFTVSAASAASPYGAAGTGGGGGGGGGSYGDAAYADEGAYGDEGGYPDEGGDEAQYPPDDGGGYAEDQGGYPDEDYAQQQTRGDYYLSQLPYGGGDDYEAYKEGYASAPEEAAEGADEYYSDEEQYDEYGSDETEDEYADEYVGGGLSLLGCDVIGEYAIQALQRQMNTLKQVTVAIARALVKGGQKVASETIATARGGLFEKELPGITSLKNTQGHLQWHADKLSGLNDPTAFYDSSDDIKKWAMQAWIDANSVEEGRARQQQIWDDMWTEIGEALAKLPKEIVQTVAALPGKLFEAVTGVPAWLFWVGGGVLVLGVGVAAWKLITLATPAVAHVAAQRYLP